MGKQQTRYRPAIRADYEYIERHEHRMCHGDGCRNAIAVWTKQRFCSRCRKEKR